MSRNPVGVQQDAGLPRSAGPAQQTAVLSIVSLVSKEAAQGCALRFGNDLRSVVLTGSLARSEGSFLQEAGLWKLRGDAEFLFILKGRARLPTDGEVHALETRIEDSLARRGILCSVSLSAAHARYFRQLQPHIFAYELRTCGKVVSGDADILRLIPDFSHADIPQEDAWQLLSNRLIEEIESLAKAGVSAAVPHELGYRTVKLYLDMATSFLLFAGAYEPTYRGRAEQLRLLARDSCRAMQPPFPLGEFSRCVDACTQWKLSPSSSLPGGAGVEFLVSAVDYAEQLWRWELAQLTGATSQTPSRELALRWMESQSLLARLRGWLYVLRKRSWLRSWPEWSRWARRAWRGSPRYWIYLAAAELVCRIPDLPLLARRNHALAVDWEELRGWLPVQNPHDSPGSREWRQLARSIAWNYREFLKDTRA